MSRGAFNRSGLTALLFAGVVSTALLLACSETSPREPSGGDTAGGGEPLVPGEGVEVTLGPQQTLLGSEALGLTYFPDMATLRISSEPERLLVVSVVSTWLVTGPTIETLDAATEVLTPEEWSGTGPLPIDNGYAGISGIHRVKSGTLYGYYHAEDHVDLPNLPGTDIPGFYARIGLATSDDEGSSWEKQGAVITSSQPKGWKFYDGQADFGAAEPGVVADPSGEYLYLYYTEHSRIGGRGVQICVARAPIDPDTGFPVISPSTTTVFSDSPASEEPTLLSSQG